MADTVVVQNATNGQASSFLSTTLNKQNELQVQRKYFAESLQKTQVQKMLTYVNNLFNISLLNSYDKNTTKQNNYTGT